MCGRAGGTLIERSLATLGNPPVIDRRLQDLTEMIKRAYATPKDVVARAAQLLDATK